MIPFVEIKDDIVVGAGHSPALGPSDLEVEGDPHSYLGCHLVDGLFVSRPVAPSPVSVDVGWEVRGAVVGSVVQIVDVLGDVELHTEVIEVDGQVIAFNLPDAGRYQVTVSAPHPFITSTTQIEVTDADPEQV